MYFHRSFMEKYNFMAQNGMTEEQISEYYVVWLEGHRAKEKYYSNTWRMNINRDDEEIENSICIPSAHAGSQRKRRRNAEFAQKNSGCGQEGDIPWSLIKPVKQSILCHYDDYSKIFEVKKKNGYSKEFNKLLNSLPNKSKVIVRELLKNTQKQEIAEQLGVSRKTISMHMRIIKATFAPYAEEHHLLTHKR